MARILVIDDDPDVLAFRKILLGSGGHEVRTLSGAESVVDEVREFRPHLVITDIMMPGLTGGGVCDALRTEFGPELPIIVSSALHVKVRSRKEKDPLLVHLSKAESPEKMLDAVQALLHKVGTPGVSAPKPSVPSPKAAAPQPQAKTASPPAAPNSQPKASTSAPTTPASKSHDPLFEFPASKSPTPKKSSC
jgi:two-component system, OmpR family, phosphate regulon response regulator PhoB